MSRRYRDTWSRTTTSWYRKGSAPPASRKCTQNHLSGRAHTHIFLVSVLHRTLAHSAWLKVQKVRVIHSVTHSSHSAMSLLNVPYRPFRHVLSSPSVTSSRPSPSTKSILHGTRVGVDGTLPGASSSSQGDKNETWGQKNMKMAKEERKGFYQTEKERQRELSQHDQGGPASTAE